MKTKTFVTMRFHPHENNVLVVSGKTPRPGVVVSGETDPMNSTTVEVNETPVVADGTDEYEFDVFIGDVLDIRTPCGHLSIKVANCYVRDHASCVTGVADFVGAWNTFASGLCGVGRWSADDDNHAVETSAWPHPVPAYTYAAAREMVRAAERVAGRGIKARRADAIGGAIRAISGLAGEVRLRGV